MTDPIFPILISWRGRLRAVSSAVALLLLTAGLGACDKPADDPTANAGSPTPAASPAKSVKHSPDPKGSADPLAGLTDLNSDKLKRKAANTFTAIDGYLKEQDPKLREKLQHAADKLTHDKDKWREKLNEKKNDLQPEIDRLRTELSKATTQAGDKSSEVLGKLKGQLDNLQFQSSDADKKLAELESATGEAWKSFKAQLKEEGNTLSADSSPASPTPAASSPSPSLP